MATLQGRKFFPENPVWKALFFLLPWVYFLVFGPYGFSTGDQGFIQGLSWRIANGEIPYLDFIYVRPPVSVYLHAIPILVIPSGLQVLTERLLFYLFCWGGVWFATQSLYIILGTQKPKLNPYLFSILAFVLTVHNFPPMPWHTTDGVLLASFGLFLIIRSGKNLFGTAGIFLLILAAGTKQGFYPMPIVGFVLISILHGFPRGLIAAGWNLIILTAALSLAHFLQPDLFPAFLMQTMGVTRLHDLLHPGFWSYLKAIPLLIPILIIWLLIQTGAIQKIQLSRLIPWAMWLPILVAAGLTTWFSFRGGQYSEPRFGYMHALWIGGMISAGWFFRQNRNASIVLAAFLALSWCAGISWGYPMPALFITPALFGWILLYQNVKPPQSGFHVALAACFFLLFLVQYQFPYRDAPRHEESYKAGSVFPKLRGIKTGATHFGQLTELDSLIRLNGSLFTVMPGFPSIHFLNHSQNPFLSDWPHNAETDFARQKDRILMQLSERTEWVYLDKSKLHRLESVSRYGCGTALFVSENWEKVSEGKYFEVYRNPERK
jgi:hypothetical protein